MTMSEADIVKNYKEAKDKKNQIEILADLNLCSRDKIKQILRSRGLRPGQDKETPPPVMRSNAHLIRDLQAEKAKNDNIRETVMVELKDQVVKLESQKNPNFSDAIKAVLDGAFLDEIELIEAEIKKLTEKREKLEAIYKELSEYIA